MTTEQTLRTSIPYHLAKLYESVQLESNARLRVILLVELFEHVLRTLGLIGLAEYNHRGLSDLQVEDSRRYLEKPSLGNWWSMVQALDKVLSAKELPFMTPPLRQSYREGMYYSAAELLAPLAEVELPKKVRPVYFFDLLVQFRNKKIGHGSLTEAEAVMVVESLEDALCDLIAGLKALQDRHLIFVRQVSWIKDHFVYDGMDLTTGASIYPALLAGQDAIAHDRLYLGNRQGSQAVSLVPLFPYFAFDRITNTIFVYNELSNKKQLILRCPYSSESLTLDEDHALVIGTGCKGPSAEADLLGDRKRKPYLQP